MEDTSVFMEKTAMPQENEVAEKLEVTYPLWVNLHQYVLEQYPGGITEWSFPGKKYGWSYRIKDKKRAILYFLPRQGYFKVAFVFGDKATEQVLASNVKQSIKDELMQARKYAEGRGVSIDIRDEIDLNDIKTLVGIKLRN